MTRFGYIRVPRVDGIWSAGRIWPITRTMAITDMEGIRVEQFWRYPVKSLKGESLQSALLTCDGVEGDRVVHVAGTRGPLTGRSRHGLLTLPATTGRDGVPLINGQRWDSSDAAEAVRKVGGRMRGWLPTSHPRVLTSSTCWLPRMAPSSCLGQDVRRLRPNLVLAGCLRSSSRGCPVRRWPSAMCSSASTRSGNGASSRRSTLTPEIRILDVLRRIRHVFGGELALNSWVIRPGSVHVGDPVR